jgi:hypothetical protein
MWLISWKNKSYEIFKVLKFWNKSSKGNNFFIKSFYIH